MLYTDFGGRSADTEGNLMGEVRVAVQASQLQEEELIVSEIDTTGKPEPTEPSPPGEGEPPSEESKPDVIWQGGPSKPGPKESPSSD
jgi:hypothetical protein